MALFDQLVTTRFLYPHDFRLPCPCPYLSSCSPGSFHNCMDCQTSRGLKMIVSREDRGNPAASTTLARLFLSSFVAHEVDGCTPWPFWFGWGGGWRLQVPWEFDLKTRQYTRNVSRVYALPKLHP